jgi:hypothetical protein
MRVREVEVRWMRVRGGCVCKGDVDVGVGVGKGDEGVGVGKGDEGEGGGR